MKNRTLYIAITIITICGIIWYNILYPVPLFSKTQFVYFIFWFSAASLFTTIVGDIMLEVQIKKESKNTNAENEKKIEEERIDE